LLCLFIGVTEKLPSELSLLGIKFSSDQQQTVGWFIFIVTVYLFIHYISASCVEFAKWVHPFYKSVIAKRRLLKHPGFDEESFTDRDALLEDDQDRNSIIRKTLVKSDWYVQGKLRPLYFFIYPKLIVEILVPFLVGLLGLFYLFQLITSTLNGA